MQQKLSFKARQLRQMHPEAAAFSIGNEVTDLLEITPLDTALEKVVID